MDIASVLWILFYLLVAAIVVVVAFIGVVSCALRRRQRLLAAKTGPLDLTGDYYRAHLKELAKELKHFDPIAKLGYDPTSGEALHRFMPVKMGTQCIFAKASVLWICKDWDDSLGLEENVAHNLEPLELFLKVGKGLHLEGFLLEIRGEEHGRDVYSFGDAVRRALKVLSDGDPHKAACMNRSYINKKGWWFEFANEPIFVTSFAPCYPKESPRFAFGIPSDSCFILLQPEYSFAWRNIEDDKTLKTQWENPVSARDKVRVAFRSEGRNYIKEGEPYDPVGAHQVVRPIGLYDAELQWWKSKAS